MPCKTHLHLCELMRHISFACGPPQCLHVKSASDLTVVGMNKNDCCR